MATKPICKYGEKCYRKNNDHLSDYDHKSNETNENKCPNIIEMNSHQSELKSNWDDKNVEATSDKYDLNSINDIRELVNGENRMKMPNDFYDLIEFLTALNPDDPKSIKTL
jgi:hypothetical protein